MEETIFFNWEGYDKQDKERKVDWFWALGIIGIAGSVLAFIFGNFFFGVFIILAIVMLIFFATQKPHKISYTLNNEGLLIEKKLLPYKDMKSFWLDETGQWGKLMIHTNHPINAITVAFFEERQQGDAIYEILIEKLEEKQLVEPISYQILEKLGF